PIAAPSRLQAVDPEHEQFKTPFLLRYCAEHGRALEQLGLHVLPAYALIAGGEVSVKRHRPDPAGDEPINGLPAASYDWHTREGRAALVRFCGVPAVREFFREHELPKIRALYLACWSVESVVADRTLVSLEVASLHLEGWLRDWFAVGVT